MMGLGSRDTFQNCCFKRSWENHVASGLNISRAAAPQTSPSMTYLQFGPWQRHTHESSLLTKPTTIESFSAKVWPSPAKWLAMWHVAFSAQCQPCHPQNLHVGFHLYLKKKSPTIPKWHLSGFLKGLWSPERGTEAMRCTNASISSKPVLGTWELKRFSPNLASSQRKIHGNPLFE